MKSILGAMWGTYWPRNENNKADDFDSEGVFGAEPGHFGVTRSVLIVPEACRFESEP